MSATGIGGNGAAGTSRLRRFGANVAAAFAAAVRTPRTDAHRPAWPAFARLAIGAAIAILVLAATMMMLDPWSIARVRGLPPSLISVFDDITDLGLSGWFLWPIGLLLVAIAVLDTRIMPRLVHGVLASLAVRLGFVFAAIAVPGLFVAVIKRLIGRARPFVTGDDTWAYQLWVWRSDHASLPSGHATTAFAAAVAIGAIWPRARMVMWIYAGVIAMSRIVVVAHHPSDVIAGAIVGTIGALLVRNWFATRRLGFAVMSDGSVQALPGPSWRRIKAVARKLLSA